MRALCKRSRAPGSKFRSAMFPCHRMLRPSRMSKPQQPQFAPRPSTSGNAGKGCDRSPLPLLSCWRQVNDSASSHVRRDVCNSSTDCLGGHRWSAGGKRVSPVAKNTLQGNTFATLCTCAVLGTGSLAAVLVWVLVRVRSSLQAFLLAALALQVSCSS